MAKIHKFDSTGDAYDATQCRDDIKRGDILVIKRERVVGLADTWPVAVTRDSGALHSVADGYSLTEGPDKFDSDTVAQAQLIALKHGWPLDLSTVSRLVRVPKVFFDDHAERDLETPEVQKTTSKHYYICRDDPALIELVDDARFYAESFDGWTQDAHRYIRAARQLVAALRRQGVNA